MEVLDDRLVSLMAACMHAPDGVQLPDWAHHIAVFSIPMEFLIWYLKYYTT